MLIVEGQEQKWLQRNAYIYIYIRNLRAPCFIQNDYNEMKPYVISAAFDTVLALVCLVGRRVIVVTALSVHVHHSC